VDCGSAVVTSLSRHTVFADHSGTHFLDHPFSIFSEGDIGNAGLGVSDGIERRGRAFCPFLTLYLHVDHSRTILSRLVISFRLLQRASALEFK